MYEKFDADFTRSCKELGIVPENAKEEEIEREEISLATMSALFGQLGFVDNNGNEKD